MHGGAKESIASFGNRLDISGAFGVIAQRISEFANCDAKAAVKVDECVFRPDVASQLLPVDDLPGVFQQYYQKPERLLLQLHPLSSFEELARAGVHLKLSESIDRIGMV